MSTQLIRSVAVRGLAAACVVTIGAIATPQVALAQPLAAEDTADCSVEAAQLNWGVKESFRSYISGSIANGEWTVSDDMRYETPDFIWNEASGSFSGDLEGGRIDFTGAVHFTGHGGAMELDIANPSIEFAGDGSAYLLLDIGATDTADAGGTAAATEVRAGKIDLTGVVASSGEGLEITAAPTRLTAEGAAALNGDYGSYVAGENLDPVTISVTGAGCELDESAASDAEEDAAPAAPVAEGVVEPADEPAGSTQIPWAPIIVGGVALLVIGVTGGMLIAGRGRGRGRGTRERDEALEEPSRVENE